MIMTIPDGTIIVREGEANMDMYKIIHGHVEAYSGYGTDHENIIGILSTGKYFGEIGLLTQKPSIYTIIAYKDVVVMRITMADMESYIKNNQRDILNIMKEMAIATCNLKYSMDRFVSDIISGKITEEEMKLYKEKLSKQFIKESLFDMEINSENVK